MYDLRARYYRQATGRFWTRDPVEGASCSPFSFHPYIYARQNPVNLTDPTGREAFAETLRLYRLPPLTVPAQQALAVAIACVFTLDATTLEALLANPLGRLYLTSPCTVSSSGRQTKCTLQDYDKQFHVAITKAMMDFLRCGFHEAGTKNLP